MAADPDTPGRPLRLTVLGVGAMNSPRYAPAGLILRYAGVRIAFDGGPGAVPPGRLDAWLVTDERSELRSALRRLAADRNVAPVMAGFVADDLHIEALPVAHTNHPTCGFRIMTTAGVAVWAPEFWTFPPWAAGADLMLAEAASWNRPIRFRGSVGGHACVRDVAAAALEEGVRRLIFVHIGRPSIRAIDAGLQPPFGEWGIEGRTYVLSSRSG